VLALSRATDLAIGQHLGFAAKAALLADRLAKAADLPREQREAVFYQGLLRYVGCNSESHAMAALLGDEIAFRRDFALIDSAKPGEIIPLVFSHLRKANAGVGPVAALINIARGLASSPKASAAILHGHCEVAERLGQRLGLAPEMCKSLGQLYARWDGKGIPAGLKGEAIALPVRLVSLAQDAMILFEAYGCDKAVEMIRQRAGKAYDPKLAALLVEHVDALMAGLDEASAAELRHIMPDDAALSGAVLDEALLAAADFIDIKSPFTLGHSRALAELARKAAAHCGLPQSSADALWRAALLHDIGNAGVPAAILAKPAAYGAADWEQIRLHSYHGERILAASDSLASLRALVGQHHERMDGSGYHRGDVAQAVSLEGRLLAAAEAYQNKIEPRPHRPALPEAAAAQALLKDVRDGKLDGKAVQAVLAATGQVPRGGALISQDQLTPREVEILRALAKGQSMKEVGRALGISPKTVDNHIQNIYPKIGVKTRGGAVLYAVEHGLTGA
jgi:HD-GYP domain-containing protein (c-di-GMP phosphodiesterase class II)